MLHTLRRLLIQQAARSPPPSFLPVVHRSAVRWLRWWGIVAVGSKVDGPRDDQGRQIGGYLCTSGSRGGLCVMVLLNMRGANQIWDRALAVDCGREKETISKLYAGGEARATSEPDFMKGLTNLRDRYNLSNVVPGLRSDSSTTAWSRGSEKGASRQAAYQFRR